MIRIATPADAAAIAGIYAPFVTDAPTSFETVAPSAEQMASRIGAILPSYPWLVEDERGVRGYAYASRHGERAAYRWSVDTAIYIGEGARRAGIGRRLYRALFALLARQGFVTAYAGATLPNPASAGLHEAMGFSRVATYTGVGFKLGAWQDVGWWQLKLREPPAAPDEPLAFAELLKQHPDEVARLLAG